MIRNLRFVWRHGIRATRPPHWSRRMQFEAALWTVLGRRA